MSQKHVISDTEELKLIFIGEDTGYKPIAK